MSRTTTIRKHLDLLQESYSGNMIDEIFEDDDIEFGGRRLNDPDISYEEVPKKKTEPENIDSVIAYLKGKKSARFTRLARRFYRAKRIKEMLAQEEKSLKKETRQAVDDLFDAADIVYTRVVDTASLVFKVGKAETRSAEKFDMKAYLEELEKLTGLTVEQLEDIRKKYTTITTSYIDPKVLEPKEKKKKNESIQESVLFEGYLDKVKEYAGLILKKTKSFVKKWDEQFASLKNEIEANL